MLALRPHERFAKDAVLIVDGPLIPTRGHWSRSPAARWSPTGSTKDPTPRGSHASDRVAGKVRVSCSTAWGRQHACPEPKPSSSGGSCQAMSL